MITREELEALIEKRNNCRKTGDFILADIIRDVLSEAGIILEDGLHGTTWKRSR